MPATSKLNRLLLGKPNEGITQREIPVTVQGLPFCSAFCGIGFHLLLVLQAILVEIQSEFPAIAKESRTVAKTVLRVLNYCETPS